MLVFPTLLGMCSATSFLSRSICGGLFNALFIPITHLALNSNMCFQVYIRGLLFRYVISNSCSVEG